MRKMSGLECSTWMNEIEMSPSVAAKKKDWKVVSQVKIYFLFGCFFRLQVSKHKNPANPCGNDAAAAFTRKEHLFCRNFSFSNWKKEIFSGYFSSLHAHAFHSCRAASFSFNDRPTKNYFLIHSIESFWLRFSQWAEQWLQEWTN